MTIQEKVEKLAKVLKEGPFYFGFEVYEKDYFCPPHAHQGETQILFVKEGRIHLEMEEGSFLISKGEGIVLGSGVEHSVWCSGTAKVLYLFHLQEMEDSGKIFSVNPFLDRLLDRALEVHSPKNKDYLESLYHLILLEIREEKSLPFSLPWPREKRLQVFFQALMDDEHHERGFDDYAIEAGSNLRTLLRLSKSELGLTLGNWRDRYRLIKAKEFLQDGHSVLETALLVGFENPSGLQKLFRKLRVPLQIQFTSATSEI